MTKAFAPWIVGSNCHVNTSKHILHAEMIVFGVITGGVCILHFLKQSDLARAEGKKLTFVLH